MRSRSSGQTSHRANAASSGAGSNTGASCGPSSTESMDEQWICRSRQPQQLVLQTSGSYGTCFAPKGFLRCRRFVLLSPRKFGPLRKQASQHGKRVVFGARSVTSRRALPNTDALRSASIAATGARTAATADLATSRHFAAARQPSRHLPMHPERQLQVQQKGEARNVCQSGMCELFRKLSRAGEAS